MSFILHRLKNLPLRLLTALATIALGDKKEATNIQVQEVIFKKNGFDRNNAMQKLELIYQSLFDEPYSESDSLSSEHLIIFSALSLSPHKIRNILEIGTYDGKTALILSALFPKAKIITMDLPADDPAFFNSYSRENQLGSFITSRDRLLRRCDNIQFEEKNSLHLTSVKADKFDLVWVDGAHGYPTVAMDICNAVRLCKESGYILVDDIWTVLKSHGSDYRSLGGYQTLTALQHAKLIVNFDLFLKRVNVKANLPWTQKYIALIKKTHSNSGICKQN
jgi:predicted O-methyltransferase YrrM